MHFSTGSAGEVNGSQQSRNLIKYCVAPLKQDHHGDQALGGGYGVVMSKTRETPVRRSRKNLGMHGPPQMPLNQGQKIINTRQIQTTHI